MLSIKENPRKIIYPLIALMTGGVIALNGDQNNSPTKSASNEKSRANNLAVSAENNMIDQGRISAQSFHSYNPKDFDLKKIDVAVENQKIFIQDAKSLKNDVNDFYNNTFKPNQKRPEHLFHVNQFINELETRKNLINTLVEKGILELDKKDLLIDKLKVGVYQSSPFPMGYEMEVWYKISTHNELLKGFSESNDIPNAKRQVEEVINK